MAQYTDPNQLSGLFKEAYGDDVINLIPEAMKILKTIEFIESDKEEGNFYNQPVIVQQEHGFTYAAALAGAFALNNSIAMATQNAKVQGSQLALRSILSYDAAAKASNSKKAFVKATELLVENMMESMSKRLEIMCLYGQSSTGLGTLNARANQSATTSRYTVTLAQWAAGIWAGAVGAELDAYSGTTKQNTNAALVIYQVDLDNRYVFVSGNSSDIAALDTAVNGSPDTIYFVFRGTGGASPADFAGVDKIVTNTGTLFNISASTYADLWKGTSYSVGSGVLTFGKVIRGLSQAVVRGLMEDVTLFVNPLTWANLNDDLAALRRFPDKSKDKFVQGTESITYWSQTGQVEVFPHIFVKQGEAFALPHKKCVRPGAQDVSFKTPGRPEDIFLHDPNRAGYELRLYTDQAFFCETPARMVKYTSIVNS